VVRSQQDGEGVVLVMAVGCQGEGSGGDGGGGGGSDALGNKLEVTLGSLFTSCSFELQWTCSIATR